MKVFRDRLGRFATAQNAVSYQEDDEYNYFMENAVLFLVAYVKRR